MAVEMIRAYGMVPLHEDQATTTPAPQPAYIPPQPAYLAPQAAPPPPPPPIPSAPTLARDQSSVWGIAAGTYLPVGAIAQSAPSPQAASIWAQLGAAVAAQPSGPGYSGPASGNWTTAGRYAPYINQYGPAGRESGYTNGSANCGPTSLAMIARAFGLRPDLDEAQLINQLGGIGRTTGAGTSINGIAAMAQSLGLPAQIRGPGAQVGWIADQLRAGKFVVANGDYFAMRPHRDPDRTSGHYVLITGSDASGRFQVLDPADPAARSVSESELQEYISSNTNGGYQIAVG